MFFDLASPSFLLLFLPPTPSFLPPTPSFLPPSSLLPPSFLPLSSSFLPPFLPLSSSFLPLSSSFLLLPPSFLPPFLLLLLPPFLLLLLPPFLLLYVSLFFRLGDEGAQPILKALLKNTTLTTLNLGSNNIGEPSAPALSEVRGLTDTHTHTHNNHFPPLPHPPSSPLSPLLPLHRCSLRTRHCRLSTSPATSLER